MKCMQEDWATWRIEKLPSDATSLVSVKKGKVINVQPLKMQPNEYGIRLKLEENFEHTV